MTNPETCRHNVVVAGISDKLELHIHCVSCETDLTDLEKRVGKNYEYDTYSHVWVHTPNKRTSRPTPLELFQEDVRAANKEE